MNVQKFNNANVAIVDVLHITFPKTNCIVVNECSMIEKSFVAISKNENYVDEIKIKGIVDFKDVDLQDKSLYRFPKLDLPRNKMDILKEKYNIKITRDIDKADYKIISKKQLEKSYQYSWHTNKMCHQISALQFIDKVKDMMTDELYVTLVDEINKYDIICISVDYQYNLNPSSATTYNAFNKGNPGNCTLNSLTIDEFKRPDKLRFHELKDKENFISLITSDNIIYDEDVVKICNEDSVVLDEQQFTNILEMVKSGDKDNISVALEIMSNCNIEESKAALGYIYAFYQYALKEAKNWNHVNVKAMKKALKSYEVWGRRDHGYIYSAFINKCLTNESLNEMVFRAIAKDIFIYVIRANFQEECPFDFKIEDIRLKPEIKEKVILEKADLPF